MKIDKVLDEYRKGDADKRMSLFLSYREYRDEFTDIEQEQPMDLDTTQPASTPSKPGLFYKTLFALHERFGCLKSRSSFPRMGH